VQLDHVIGQPSGYAGHERFLERPGRDDDLTGGDRAAVGVDDEPVDDLLDAGGDTLQPDG
jgi:hypothetical protein